MTAIVRLISVETNRN